MSKTIAPESAQPTGYASSLDDVAGKLGCSARQWATYSKRPNFPSKTEKGYDLAALAAWKAENVGTAKGDETLRSLKAEKTREEIELLKIRRAKEEKRVVSIDDVDELHRTMALKLRALLYSKLENEMPPKLAGCDALTIRKYGRALADEIVRTLAKEVDQWSDK